MSPWISLLAGLALLYFGAGELIRGGVALSLRLGLSSLAVGLTVIAYGTGSPELVVSVQASFSGQGALSLGNVIGSNICNVLLILGVAATLAPIRAQVQVVRREIPVMIAATLLVLALLADGELGRLDGAILAMAVVAYTFLTLRDARLARSSEAEAEYNEELPEVGSMGPWAAALLALFGLGVLVLGSTLFVDGAVRLAQGWGMSEAVIGLTVVAVGTSLPELATSALASLKGEPDVAIGNVVGSNIFNLLAILGLTALIHPVDASGISGVDLAVMLGSSLLLYPVSRLRGKIGRLEGVLMLVGFVAYSLWLVQSHA